MPSDSQICDIRKRWPKSPPVGLNSTEIRLGKFSKSRCRFYKPPVGSEARDFSIYTDGWMRINVTPAYPASSPPCYSSFNFGACIPLQKITL